MVLAAGASSRMGENKLVIDLDGETVVRRAVRQTCEAGLSPVVVVVGYEAGHTVRALTGLKVEIVENDRYAKGMNTSVRAGLDRVPERCVGAIVTLADMPLVTASMMEALVETYRRSEAPLVISRFGDVHAPPTLYDRSLFADFHGTGGEGAGRWVVRRHRAAAAVVAWPADRLTDLDEPADVDRVRTLLSRHVT